MAFELNNVLTCIFEDTGPIGAGIQIVNTELSNAEFSYSLYPTNYSGVRGQHDSAGNTYYEWQWYVPGGILGTNQYFIISYKVWPDPVVGGPDGNTGRQRFAVANSLGGRWNTLFLSDVYEPWSLIFPTEEFTPQSPISQTGTATISDDDKGTTFITDPIQTPERPPEYDPDLGWDEPGRAWVPTSRGGGRYRQQIIAIGKEGEIYYGDAG